MGLRDISLKSVYNSDEENLLLDFYIPVLTESISYSRIAGFFSSNSLAIAAKGLASFIRNGGKIKLLTNVILSEKDKDAINKAILDKEQLLLEEINNLEDELKKDHIRMLSWLIKSRLLEIKIAVVEKGIEHQKMGILTDGEGNILSFSGSDNETVNGWIYNDEQFHVFCNWKEGDREHLNPDLERFDRLWNDKANTVRVYNASEALYRGLIKIAPSDDSEFIQLSKTSTEKLIKESSISPTKKKMRSLTANLQRKLWSFQREAIDCWKSNNYRGIISMATGTGKTKTAIAGIAQLRESQDPLAVIICAPQNTIVRQWESELDSLMLFQRKVTADGTNHNWKRNLSDKIIDYNSGLISDIIVFTTYNTLSNPHFVSIISTTSKPILLVCDEVHWAGATTFKKGLLDIFKYRLGLSATPERYMDDDGTNDLIGYFEKVVYDEFPIERALREINPLTNKPFLCPYNYYPKFVDLNKKELGEYYDLSEQISKQYAREKNKKDPSSRYQRLCERRQAIIVNAERKYKLLSTILRTSCRHQYLLVYCSPQQIDIVQDTLSNFLIINHRFTGQEGIRPNKRFNGLSERDNILKDFENGTYKALVAMKCLDEGINIERAENAILMANSGNPKEYIQRRGRILRTHKDKRIANIFDILVVPFLNKDEAANATENDLKILKKEFKRYDEFATSANNHLEALTEIYAIKTIYGLL